MEIRLSKMKLWKRNFSSSNSRKKNYSFTSVLLESCFENRWTAVFSHEFLSIMARIHTKKNENLSVLAASFSRELRHVKTRKHSMTSQDRHLECESDPKEMRFATLSWLLLQSYFQQTA